jgi:predicted AlkP superfamily phosphohydrolase/phosphomutase
VRVNLKGREKNGIIEPGEEFEELAENIRSELLENCRDSATGEKIVAQVLRKEEIYSGKYVSKAPDLLIKWREDCLISGILLDDKPSRSAAKAKPRVSVYKSFITGEDPGVISGDHHTTGIFMLYGPGVKSGHDVGRCDLVDLTPTIYRLLGLPPSEEFDGEPLLDCFEDNALSSADNKPEAQRDASER